MPAVHPVSKVVVVTEAVYVKSKSSWDKLKWLLFLLLIPVALIAVGGWIYSRRSKRNALVDAFDPDSGVADATYKNYEAPQDDAHSFQADYPQPAYRGIIADGDHVPVRTDSY